MLQKVGVNATLRQTGYLYKLTIFNQIVILDCDSIDFDSQLQQTLESMYLLNHIKNSTVLQCYKHINTDKPLCNLVN